MGKLYTLGVEPYPGKVPEDPVGPIDANRRTDPYARMLPTQTPAEWVNALVGQRMLELDSMRWHFKTEAGTYVEQAAVLKRWLMNGEQALRTQGEADIVLGALQRMPADPVDPSETPDVRRSRDAVLALTRVRVLTRRGSLPAS